MSLRQHFKHWLYGRCPGFAGVYPYFGSRIHFPKGSLLFRLVCEQGVFESENLNLLRDHTKPGTWLFDVGANIGLMSAPIVAQVPEARVLSFEASPNVLPYLEQTISESPFADRWSLVPKAAGAATGQVSFALSAAEHSVFDGIRSTHRTETVREVTVEMTTVDSEWQRLGSPKVSAIKIDVEGAELDVLRGARTCLEGSCPVLLVEWNPQNLAAYDVDPAALLEFAGTVGYEVFALPHCSAIQSPAALRLHMTRTESFFLAPA